MLVGLSAGYLIGMALAWLALLLGLLAFVAMKAWRWRSRPRRFAARSFVVVWTLGFAALFAETAFSMFYDTTDSFRLAKTSERWYLRHVKANNWGYRDARKFTTQLDPGVTRILVVGDSFAFGHGIADVKERLGERLERRLNETPGAKFEVYTAARPGADSAECLNLLKDVFDRGLKCDLVLLIYNLNDIETLVPEINAVVMGSILCTHPSEGNLFLRELYLPNFLYYRYQQFGRPEVRDYFGWLVDAYRGPAFAKQGDRLDAIEALCRQQGARFAVCIFPFLHDLPNYRFGIANAALAEHFKTKGVPFLDLLEPLQAHAGEGLVVNRYDAHPNEKAHDIAAAAVASWLRPLLAGP